MIWKIFWEFPLTTSFSLFLILFYLGIQYSLPYSIIVKNFYSYPGQFKITNWFLSSLFHSSFSHLFSNVIFLYLLGRAVENKIGKLKWLMFYLLAGIISMMFDSIIRGFFLGERNIPAVGASGAISGLAAVAMVLSPMSYKIGGVNFPLPVFLVAWMMLYSDLIRLFSSDNIAHWAHLSGFFSVFLISYLLNKTEREKFKLNFIFNFIFFIMTIILLFFLENR